MVKTKKIILPGPDDYNIPPENFHDYTVLLMGAKGIGKTTASSSFPGNLNVMWEPRRKNVKLRMIGADEGIMVRPAQEIINGADDPWQLFIEYCAAAVEDPTINTITFDTVDLAYQACFESVCARLGVTHPNQIKDDYGASWNTIKNEFNALIDTIRASEKLGLLLISHVKERDQEFQEGSGTLSIIGPSCAPACLQILKSACEFWLYYGWKDGERTVFCRDPDRLIDVACGTGFMDPDSGEPLTSFTIPRNPDKFYDTLNAAFRGSSKPTQTTKKVVKKKTAKKKGAKRKRA